MTLRVTLSTERRSCPFRCGAGAACGALTGRAVKGNALQRTVRIRARGLRPGRYRVVLIARDAAGSRSKTKRLRLRVR